MHFGLPILTSDLDFARYVCDDTAIYFDFWNIDDIAEKICLIRDDSGLRQKLVKNGKERVPGFFCEWPEIVAKIIKELGKLFINWKNVLDKY